MNRWCFCLLALWLASASRGEDLKLWYTQPAKTWMTEALPLGNGRLGAMVFGGVAQEHIQFNEDSLWSGGPSDLAGNLPGGAEHVKEIQDLIAGRQFPQATRLIQKHLYGNPRNLGSYQPFGDIVIDQHSAADAARATDYRRELDITHAVARVHYVMDGVSYDREYFASHPDHVLVLHLSCSKPGGLNLLLHLTTPQAGATIKASGAKLTLDGKLAGNGLAFGATLSVRAEGTSALSSPSGDGLEIKNADTLTVYLAAGTEYDANSPTYRGNDFAAANAAAIVGVKYRSYADLLAAHEKDYTALFNRVDLDLGHGDAEKLPTDQRLAAYHKGAADPGLVSLFFQYGRYLLISCSRPGGLPSNRQGLWNNDAKVQWGADFPTMMNLEMMYWPAETTNLSECTEPLIAMIDRLRAPGRVAAKTVYGVRGWIVNYTTNPWGFTGAGTSPYQYFPAGAAWLCRHIWEHYAFTQDKNYLAKTAYPIMKEAAEFWVDHLIADTDGTLVSSPSESPEHGGFVAGAVMDQEIIWDLFTNTIEAETALGVDFDIRTKLQEMAGRLSPPKIGRLGQLQEWKEDVDDAKDTHRHVSQLFALYPGHQIDPATTPALADAAKKSLEFRGDAGIGWAMAWKIGFWARLGDGDHALSILTSLLTPTAQTSPRSSAAGTYANLFTARPPLQVDGSFAAVAAIAEMLLQSQNGDIHLLPALPKSWPAGSVKGLKARGGFEVDESWSNGLITDATVRSLAGGVCRIRCAAALNLADHRDARRPGPNVIEFDTIPGNTYRLIAATAAVP